LWQGFSSTKDGRVCYFVGSCVSKYNKRLVGLIEGLLVRCRGFTLIIPTPEKRGSFKCGVVHFTCLNLQGRLFGSFRGVGIQELHQWFGYWLGWITKEQAILPIARVSGQGPPSEMGLIRCWFLFEMQSLLGVIQHGSQV